MAALLFFVGLLFSRDAFCLRQDTSPIPRRSLPSYLSSATAPILDSLLGQCLAVHNASPNGDKHTSVHSDGIPEPSHDDALRGHSVLSFEDWKEAKERRTPRIRQNRRDSPSPRDGDSVIDDLGDERELSFDINGVTHYDLPHDGHDQTSHLVDPRTSQEQDGVAVQYDASAHDYRSKDAGKTCKERFSYSSFDAGATVLKTNGAAKNPKAILVENKDSYMLLECADENKYVIVELSDDILVDTVVLANFEFFSSMIRHFRVSVSDRYPAKLDKWSDLGTFEARNSRDIQPFLVENPRIWAKFVRIEFLTHYGNEYYCPVSLLRIHGTRMLESWKETESNTEEEADRLLLDHTHELGDHGDDEPGPLPGLAWPTDISIPNHLLEELLLSTESCPADSSHGHKGRIQTISIAVSPPASSARLPRKNIEVDVGDDAIAAETTSTSVSAPESSTTRPVSTSIRGGAEMADWDPDDRSQDSKPGGSLPQGVTKQHSTGNPGPPRNRTTSAQSATTSASPTVQESFFKSIAKRLQVVEANMTLSVKYLEDQARSFREALQSSENRHLSKIEVFMTELNQTVLAELHGLRQQYDQVWQSTITALDIHRERSQREIVALSSRLNLLADEVVFQKRMAIVQSSLLLACLILVIFAKGSSAASNPFSADFLQRPGASSSTGKGQVSLGLRSERHRIGHGVSRWPLEPSGRNRVEDCHSKVGSRPSDDSFSKNMGGLQKPSPPRSPAQGELDVTSNGVGVTDRPANSWRVCPSNVTSQRTALPALPEYPD